MEFQNRFHMTPEQNLFLAKKKCDENVYCSMRQELLAILQDDTTATEKALNAFAWGTRGQFFWDGNKRTSLILANKILIAAGAGILTITDKYGGL